MDTVTMTHAEYRDLIDSRDHAMAMRAVEMNAMETLSEKEVDAYLAAPSPLAFWRRQRGFTQAALAEQVGLTQPHIAQAERGVRGLSIGVHARIAQALRVRIEDLVPVEDA